MNDQDTNPTPLEPTDPPAAFDAKQFLANLTSRPGVYQMLDESQQVLYVGKAKDLKKRVSSYFRSRGLTTKTLALVGRIRDIQITVTHSETEALLLEQTLIKEIRPPFNVLLRDDKSYPFIYLSATTGFPHLALRRGAKKETGQYFGPYPSSGAVRETIHLLQKAFKIRSCEDSFFRNRSRPCLQYQIKRCTGPCVDLISQEDYQADVEHAKMFIEGRSDSLVNELQALMDQAAEQLNFEQAARYRDQITYLRQVVERQYMINGSGDVDVVGALIKPAGSCVHMLFVRNGRVVGSKTYYPKLKVDASVAELTSQFIAQYYLGIAGHREFPADIIVATELEDQEVLQAALQEVAKRKIDISHSVRGERLRWQRLAVTNAEQNLIANLANKENLQQRYVDFQNRLKLDAEPQRLECFDISHTSGEATVASCVVFNHSGPAKSEYRRFNIKDVAAGDDYGAMRQAISRRYTRLKKEDAKLPDFLIVDGGKGQLNIACEVLEELQCPEIKVIGVAKGTTRKPGLERLFLHFDQREIVLPSDAPALHLIQHIRDEAHRFAIQGHRAQRAKTRTQSVIDQIPGIGPKRRRELIRYFGGVEGIKRASKEDLAKVPNISERLAEDIYHYLHGH